MATQWAYAKDTLSSRMWYRHEVTVSYNLENFVLSQQPSLKLSYSLCFH